MSIWIAVFWGALSSAALYLGQALAAPMAGKVRATGLVMGFGAGTLLSAIAYQLIPAGKIGSGSLLAAGLATGAGVYYIADQILDRRGAGTRQSISTVALSPDGPGAPPAAAKVSGTGPDGSANAPGTAQTGPQARAAGADDAGGGGGLAMFLGALLDGIPEAFVLGSSLALGGAVSAAFLAAVFVSNIPQGVAGTASLRASGHSSRRIFGMWTGLTVACGAVAGLGFAVGGRLTDHGLFAESFAAGALLMMLADSMIPEAYRNGGKTVGLLTVAGYLAAAALAAA